MKDRHICAAKTVDGLLGVADDEELAGARRESAQDARLNRRGVLKLVYHQGADKSVLGVVVMSADLFVLIEQGIGQLFEIVEVERRTITFERSKTRANSPKQLGQPRRHVRRHAVGVVHLKRQQLF